MGYIRKISHAEWLQQQYKDSHYATVIELAWCYAYMRYILTEDLEDVVDDLIERAQYSRAGIAEYVEFEKVSNAIEEYRLAWLLKGGLHE